MIESRISQIIKDNTLVDNHMYERNGNVFRDVYGNNELLIEGRNENSVFNFLVDINSDFSNSFFEKHNNKVVLFNSKEYEHNSTDSFISLNGKDITNFTLQTGNIIGYISNGKYSIKISSRFGDNFLKFIISDADGFLEVPNRGGTSSENSYEWLLVFLWKIKLLKAYRLGIPKKYINQKNKLRVVRGNLNLLNYYTVGKDIGIYECEYRELNYGNDVTNLISSVFRKIGKHNLLSDCTRIKITFHSLVTKQKPSRTELLQTNHFSNPYYYHYNDVIDLSKYLILGKSSDFGDSSLESAFLFDVSMLFEYFVRKLLKRSGYFLQSKSEKSLYILTGGINNERKLIPDIVFTSSGKDYLFDVKYKHFDFTNGAKREDLFQLHTYVGQYGNHTKISACGFIHPIRAEEFEKKVKNDFIHNKIKINGHEVDFYILFIIVPDNNIDDYITKFKSYTDKFLDQIKKITKNQ